MCFTNKVVVITGAGSGIGEATAVHFANLSANLALIDINEDNLRRTSEHCEKLSNAKVLKIVADVSKDKNVKQAVDNIIKEYETIDVVMNCAGVFSNVGILDPDTMSVFDKVINVNLRSMVAMIHYTAPALIKSKGCVINMASVLAKTTNVGTIFYSVSKAAVVHFTKNVALELAHKGVRVNCISPGLVDTNFLINAGMSQHVNDEYFNHIATSVPLQRVTKGEEIANMVEYLASDKAKSITGTDFVIDAGYELLGLQTASRKLKD